MADSALSYSLFPHPGILHVAKVAQQRECAQPLLREQPLPVCTLVSTSGKSHFPGIGSEQISFDQTPPQPCLVRVLWLRVAKEQYVAQADYTRTVVLGQCILVELGERCSQALLHLARQRSTAVRPVDRHELR